MCCVLSIPLPSIATKCDDISPREVIEQLNLGSEPTLLEIQRRIEDFKEMIKALTHSKAVTMRQIQSAEKNVESVWSLILDFDTDFTLGERMQGGTGYVQGTHKDGCSLA